MHLLGRIATVTAGRAHRGEAALARPVRDGALGHLEEERDLAGPQESSGERLAGCATAEQEPMAMAASAMRLSGPATSRAAAMAMEITK